MDDIPMIDAELASRQNETRILAGLYPYHHVYNNPDYLRHMTTRINRPFYSDDNNFMGVKYPKDVELVTSGRDINRRIASLYPGVDPKVTPLPTHWSSIDRRETIYVSADKTLLKYKGLGVNHNDAASVRANHSIPLGCGVYYFEVTIITPERKWAFSATNSLIGIGIMEKNILTNRLPGWDNLSFGYHGDDGHFFCSSGKGTDYGPNFGINDTVGCGVNFANKQIFFTKNGENLGYLDINLPLDHEYYPVVGMQACNEVVQTNFGQRPFLYDIEKDFKKVKNYAKKSLNSIQLPPEKALWMNDAVANWLVHLGYAEATQAFVDQTNIKIKYDPEFMKKRQEAVQIIKSGKISEHLNEIFENFNLTFSKSEYKALLVLLKVQAFIEDMMKVVRQMKNPTPIEPQPGSSRMPTRASQNIQQQQLQSSSSSSTRRKNSPSSSNASAASSQRSGTKRRNSQTMAGESGSSNPQQNQTNATNVHRSYSRNSSSGSASAAGVAVNAGTLNSQNGFNSENANIESSNGHDKNQKNGCPTTTTTIIAEMYESNGSSAGNYYDDTEMEDLSALMPPPRRRKEIITKNSIEEYKPYLEIIEKSRDLWGIVKNMKDIPESIYVKVTKVLEMMITDPDLIKDKYADLISQEHREYVATVFNRTTMHAASEGDSKKGQQLPPISKNISYLENLHPQLSLLSPGGITFAKVDEIIFSNFLDKNNENNSIDNESDDEQQPSSPETDENDSGDEDDEDIEGGGGHEDEDEIDDDLIIMHRNDIDENDINIADEE